jgi:hypothetical protein
VPPISYIRVFGTKERRALIPAELQEQLYAYLIRIVDNLDFKNLAAGGTRTTFLCSSGCRLR